MGLDGRDSLHADWPVLLAEQARANSKLLFSLAYRVLRDPAAAEDACQKALLTAWIRRDEITDPSRLKGWLATAVINESLAVLRRQKVEQKVLKLVAAGAAIGEVCSFDHEALRHATVLALANLGDGERAAVSLRVMIGLSGREVAQMLGISDGQVSKLLHRGMEELRIALVEWKDQSR